MCVIVHQDEQAWIDKETARKLWTTNPDGGGFAFVDDNGDLQITKAMAFQTFWSEFEQARSVHGKRDYLLHMRIATHGAISLDNVHPFKVDDHTVMAHNGIIHAVTDMLPKDNSVSDTRLFVEHLLPQLEPGWLDKPFIVDMVDTYIDWSKLMFITTDPALENTVYRIGNWVKYEGLYLSNDNGLVKKKSAKRSAKTFDTFPYSENSRNWDDWYDMRTTPTEWGFDQLLSDLEFERESMGIDYVMVVVDEEKLQIDCTGCFEQINVETGECSCWDKVCGECWNWVATCEGKGLCKDSIQYDFEILSDQGKEKVYAAKQLQEENQPALALVYSKDAGEAGNTE